MQPEGPRLRRGKKRPIENEEDDHDEALTVHTVMEPTTTAIPERSADEELPDRACSQSPPTSPNQIFETARNIFGLVRQYFTKPARIPDLQNNIASSLSTSSPLVPDTAKVLDILHPFKTLSAFQYQYVFASFDRLSDTFQSSLSNVINLPGFIPQDIKGVDWGKIREEVAQCSRPWEEKRHGWREHKISIQVPDLDKSKSKPKPARVNNNLGNKDNSYKVDEVFWYRPIVPSLKSILTSDESKNFHYEPFEQRWQTPATTTTSSSARVYDELYTGDAWLEEHRNVQSIILPPEEDDQYPRAIAAIMLWSDSTHLAEFGQAKAWPIYMSLGNQSKYERAKPGAHALHHLAYLPSVSSYPNKF